jgi:hypothetical protein
MELLKAHLSALLGICKLHIQISSIHMCVVPGPASMDPDHGPMLRWSSVGCALSYYG